MREMVEEYGMCIVMMILGIGLIAGLSYLLDAIVSGSIWTLWYA